MTLCRSTMMDPLYTPSAMRPMHVVVFGSGSGTNLEALLRAQHAYTIQPPFEVKALFTDRLCRLHDIGAKHKIPVIHHSFKSFSERHPDKDNLREEYDRENARLLIDEADRRGFQIDLILLAGYMRLVHQPLLEMFPKKIINIHPADLRVCNPDGTRRYVGTNAVRDALWAGETRTRSSVILVDEKVDNGPILVEGPWVDYEEGYPIDDERVARHQAKQKILSDWPACITAVQKIALDCKE